MAAALRDEMRAVRANSIEWAITDLPVAYPDAMQAMTVRAQAIRDGVANELIWLLQHPPLITAGTSAKPHHLLEPGLLPVFESGRGGQYTYHGPGQRIAYLMLDLRRRGSDVRKLVGDLERWITLALGEFNVVGVTRPNRVGIWVKRQGSTDGTEDKIAAIGLRVSGGVTSHGVSINVDPDLSHYRAIVPCGIEDAGVTSLTALGLPVTLVDVDVALRRAFEVVFGTAQRIQPPSLPTKLPA